MEQGIKYCAILSAYKLCPSSFLYACVLVFLTAGFSVHLRFSPENGSFIWKSGPNREEDPDMYDLLAI